MNGLAEFIQKARILIVGEDQGEARALENQLRTALASNVFCTTGSRDVLAVLEQFKPDLILLDLTMPHAAGFKVLAEIQTAFSSGAFVPTIALMSDRDPQSRKRALEGGAKDFVVKPVDPGELELRVTNLLEARFLHLELQRREQRSASTGQVATRELDKALQEEKAAQEQLVDKERLDAFSTITDSLAPVLGKSAAVIGETCETLLSESGLGDPVAVRRNLEAIVCATKDVTRMVDRLQNCWRAKSESEIYCALQLSDIVRAAVEFAQPKLKNLAQGSGSYIAVTADVPEELALRGDASELREMLLNLIHNAVDAMPQGGHLSIRAKATAQNVVLEVSDTGIGMPDDVKRRCFDPFVTTKTEHGAGLGLTVALGIVRRHQGTIEVVTDTSRGATFTIRLPREVSVPQKQKAADTRKLPPVRILFADDDAAIRRVVSMSLQRDGHTVTAVSDGSEALELYEPGKFDLVLTDLSMPRMSGEKLARAIKDACPEQPIIILTGYGDMLLKNGPKPPYVDLLINKPVTSAELSKAIAQVLTSVVPSRSEPLPEEDKTRVD